MSTTVDDWVVLLFARNEGDREALREAFTEARRQAVAQDRARIRAAVLELPSPEFDVAIALDNVLLIVNDKPINMLDPNP